MKERILTIIQALAIPERRGSVMHHYIMVTDTMVNDCIRRVIDNLNADKKSTHSFAAAGAMSNI